MFDIPLHALRSPLFRPGYVSQMTLPTLTAVLSCGPAALYTLTGDQPIDILKFCTEFVDEDTRPGTSASCMIAYLESRGYTVRKFSNEDVCRKRGEMQNALNSDHVLLSARHVAHGTTSWFVNWGHLEFHSLYEQVVSSLTYLNRPPTENEGIYVVHHPSWKLNLRELEAYYQSTCCLKATPDEMVVRANEAMTTTKQVINLVGTAIEKILDPAAEENPEAFRASILQIKNTLSRIQTFGVLNEMKLPAKGKTPTEVQG